MAPTTTLKRERSRHRFEIGQRLGWSWPGTWAAEGCRAVRAGLQATVAGLFGGRRLGAARRFGVLRGCSASGSGTPQASTISISPPRSGGWLAGTPTTPSQSAAWHWTGSAVHFSHTKAPHARRHPLSGPCVRRRRSWVEAALMANGTTAVNTVSGAPTANSTTTPKSTVTRALEWCLRHRLAARS